MLDNSENLSFSELYSRVFKAQATPHSSGYRLIGRLVDFHSICVSSNLTNRTLYEVLYSMMDL